MMPMLSPGQQQWTIQHANQFMGSQPVQQPFTPESADVAEIRAKFAELDVNRDGCLSKEELVNLMMESGCDRNKAESHAAGFFKIADKDGVGKVSFHEFMQEYVRMMTFKVCSSSSLFL